MRIFGNPIGIIVGSSASLAAGSSSLDQPFQALNFTYLGPYDISTTGSVASIETILMSASNSTESGGGVAGALSFKVSDPSNLNTTGSEVMRMFITSSEPRVGIGFEKDESPLTAFEVKSKKNSSEGTELLLRTSRTTIGAVVGDSAGTINFIIDSSSYSPKDKTQFIQSGSIASITTQVTTVSKAGVQGHLKFNTARSNTEAGRSLWTMGYAADPRVLGNMGTITTGSLNIVRTSNNVDDMLTLTHTDDSYISLQYITGSTSSNDATTINSFTTSSYSGVIYDYALVNPGNGARTGQIMAIWDNGNIEMTDVSTPSLGSSTPPSFTTTLGGANNNIFNLKITDGGGYFFKAFVKKL